MRCRATGQCADPTDQRGRPAPGTPMAFTASPSPAPHRPTAGEAAGQRRTRVPAGTGSRSQRRPQPRPPRERGQRQWRVLPELRGDDKRARGKPTPDPHPVDSGYRHGTTHPHQDGPTRPPQGDDHLKEGADLHPLTIQVTAGTPGTVDVRLLWVEEGGLPRFRRGRRLKSAVETRSRSVGVRPRRSRHDVRPIRAGW
jgi:hypothetical protein